MIKKFSLFTLHWFEDHIRTTKPLYGYATMLFCSSKQMSIFLVHYAPYCLISTLNHELEWKKKRKKKKRKKKHERNQKSTHVSPNYFLKPEIGTAQIFNLVVFSITKQNSMSKRLNHLTGNGTKQNKTKTDKQTNKKTKTNKKCW